MKLSKVSGMCRNRPRGIEGGQGHCEDLRLSRGIILIDGADNDGLADPRSHIDDEYAKVGTYDPKIVITTSRSPSSRLLQFSKVSSRNVSAAFMCTC